MTSSQAVHESVQRFKSADSSWWGQINYANVIAVHLYQVSLVSLCKQVVFAIAVGSKITVSRPVDGTVTWVFYFERHQSRRDYDHIADTLRRSAGASAAYAEGTDAVSPLQIVRTLREVRRAIPCCAGLDASLIRRTAAVLLIARYMSLSRALAPLVSKAAKVATFCDARPMDNLVAQLARAGGIESVTAQHGQYRVLDDTNMSADAEAYANFVSDQLLCWGPATVEEFARAGVDRSRMVVAGWIRDWPSKPPLGSMATFGVMLNGENAKESNQVLLDLAETLANTLDLSYVVRMHPRNHQADYATENLHRCTRFSTFGLVEYLEKVHFSIAHMSGAVIECLHLGAPVYLFDDGKLASVFAVDGLAFDNEQDLTRAVVSDRRHPRDSEIRFRRLAQWFNDDSRQESVLHDLGRAKE